MSVRLSLGMVMSRLTPNEIAEPILGDQILRCKPRQGNIQFRTRGREFSYFSFYIREKVLRICVSRESSQNMFLYLGNMLEVTVIGSKPAVRSPTSPPPTFCHPAHAIPDAS